MRTIDEIDREIQRATDSFLADVAQIIRVSAFEAVKNTLDGMKSFSRTVAESRPASSATTPAARIEKPDPPHTHATGDVAGGDSDDGSADRGGGNAPPYERWREFPWPRSKPPDPVAHMSRRIAGVIYGNARKQPTLGDIAQVLGVTVDDLAPAVERLLADRRFTKVGDGADAKFTQVETERTLLQRAKRRREREEADERMLASGRQPPVRGTPVGAASAPSDAVATTATTDALPDLWSDRSWSKKLPVDPLFQMTRRIGGTLNGKPGTPRTLAYVASKLDVTIDALMPAVEKMIADSRITLTGDGPEAVLTAVVSERTLERRAARVRADEKIAARRRAMDETWQRRPIANTPRPVQSRVAERLPRQSESHTARRSPERTAKIGADILAFIRARPGVGAALIRRELGLSNATSTYVLRRLRGANKLVAHGVKRGMTYGPP